MEAAQRRPDQQVISQHLFPLPLFAADMTASVRVATVYELTVS